MRERMTPEDSIGVAPPEVPNSSVGISAKTAEDCTLLFDTRQPFESREICPAGRVFMECGCERHSSGAGLP
jgi:hypothetical protein